MSTDTYAWLDRYPCNEENAFGHSRLELQLAERTFRPDMLDDLLLRFYCFVLDREQYSVWLPLLHLTEGLVHLRMCGPRWCPPEYARWFDPEDSAKALEAVSAAVLPNKDLVSVFLQAQLHSRTTPNCGVSEYAEGWTKVYPLARSQILSRMEAGRGIIGSTVPAGKLLLQADGDGPS